MNNLYHVIKDPVHGTMQFTSTEDAWMKPFIDSPLFQRLRHIKQLGMGDFIFPGAVHTRFNHCLGCCYIGSQIAQKIGISDADRQLVMIACLLHDIGHGPFSHAFEDIFNKSIRHEDWTPYFLADYNLAFFTDYNQSNPRHRLSEEKFQLIGEMIMHKTQQKNVLADIVSSQLDADRLDYLLRDSHFCGVRYGEFDFRWMLHCMAIVDSGDAKRLGITHKGIGVVEHYLMARRLMMRNIYHSQKKLAFEALLVQLLAHLAAELKQAPYQGIRHLPLARFLMAAHRYNQGEVTKAVFLEENYVIYKMLCDYDVFSLIALLAGENARHPAYQIAARLYYRHMPKIIRLDDANLSVVKAELEEFKASHPEFQEWQLMLIQTPHQAYSGESDPILVINEKAQVQPINRYSLTINAISDKEEHTAFISIDSLIAEAPSIVQLMHHLKALPNEILEGEPVFA